MYEDHEMGVAGTQPGGIELWICPTCFKVVIMKLPEGIVKDIVNAGNLMASHSLTKMKLAVENTGIRLEEMGPFKDFLEAL